jgi:uncharacterized protein YqcC (DUF446 family)
METEEWLLLTVAPRMAWSVADEEITDQLAIKAAADEAVESQLPGRENGAPRTLTATCCGVPS